ncbi:PQQ-binding-like beta-propeller repeat protein [Nocardioides sp.]|uniref:outer membrane protein assembly factor BamB family protein n=1 Tax=Nocardioides sp. TaxID=35761 RepID=UPI00273644DA|nr:PQQ-binding-like beta-propeller repeat protein [Nocardioides sp.]MDP3893105.1 PQQ-binding-like beta-propeller repeat protein [Nocardioides sp.]
MSSRWRRVASWVPAAAVVPLAMAGAYVVSEPEEQYPDLVRLHPLEVGTTWVYEVFDHGRPSGTRTRQVRGDAGLIDESGLVEAVQVTSDYTDYPGSGAQSSLTYLGLRDDAILQFSLRSQLTNKPLEPPAPAYRLPLEEGASWSYEGTLDATTTISYEATLSDIGDVEVGGRTFADCAHYVNRFDIEFADGSKGDREVTDEWTCPGYGPVRVQAAIEAQDVLVTEELVEFHGVHTEWRAEDADRVVEPTVVPLGTTVGLTPERTNAVPDGELRPDLAWTDARDQRLSFGPASDGDVMVVGDIVGDVAATEVSTGAVRWRLSLPGPIVAPPVIVGDTAFLADAAKNLLAVDTTTGATRWVHHFDDVVSAAPTALGSALLVATDDGLVTALDLADGEVQWADTRAGPVRAAPARAADRWLVADVTGALTAYTESGDTAWSVALEEALAVGPTVTDGVVAVADAGGIISAFDTSDGAVAWQAQTSSYPNEAFAVSDGVLVAVEDGERLEAFDTSDGTRLWRVEEDRLRSAPVIVGEQVVNVLSVGEVVVRDLASGAVEDRWLLPRVTADAEVDSDIEPTVIRDTLVIGAAVSAAENTAALYAYPLSPAATTRGVYLRTDDVRELGTAPSGVPVSADGTVFVAATDSVLYRATRDGAVPIHTSSQFQPPPAVGQGLLVAQHDEEYVAYPVAGGDPLWRLPTEAPTPGVQPAIGEDAVFLPQYQVGLSAVAFDGTPLWDRPLLGAFGPTSPVLLPGGDVVYGAAGLTRFAGDTGETVWTDPDALLPGFPAYAEGVVYADVISQTAESGLRAYSADDGRRLWSVPVPDPLFGGGPAVAEDVVVDVDSGGVVRALDARDGAELWSLRLTSTPAGAAVILDGRVYLMELGRTEDLFTRDLRLSVHDLHTGRFLASYEPATTPYLSAPVLGPGPDGTVLVPNGTGFGALLVMEPAS